MGGTGGIGPIQLLTVAFGPEAEFEGRILAELTTLEANGQIRVLDILFVQKDTEGDLIALDYQAEDMGDTVAALLGLDREGLRGAEEEYPSVAEGHALGLSVEEIKATADALDPGTAMGFILFEHVWARHLRAAIRDAGGVPVAEGFLTEEALAPVAVELAAAAERHKEPQKEPQEEPQKPPRTPAPAGRGAQHRPSRRRK